MKSITICGELFVFNRLKLMAVIHNYKVITLSKDMPQKLSVQTRAGSNKTFRLQITGTEVIQNWVNVIYGKPWKKVLWSWEPSQQLTCRKSYNCIFLYFFVFFLKISSFLVRTVWIFQRTSNFWATLYDLKIEYFTFLLLSLFLSVLFLCILCIYI